VGAPPSHVIQGLAARALIVASGLAIGCASPTADAADSRLIPGAACRDGRVSGAYTLRMSNGRVRTVGAYHDGKRTGTFIFWNESGARVAAIPYDENVRNGTIALWQPGARPRRDMVRKLEAPVVKGEPHGVHRAWHANGQLQYEATYEHGELHDVSAWDAKGNRLSSPEAKRIAEAARKRDEAYLAALEKMIADHQPRCDDSIKADTFVVDPRG